MTVSRNEERFGFDATPHPSEQAPTQGDPLSFSVPTEFVDLPSRGRFYPEGHTLYNVDSIEIKYMTAKEEDILTSQSLLKKGVAIDRLLQSVIIDKRIKVQDLLVGDKNALLVATRVTGYGGEYNTAVRCPSCGATEEQSFDLEGLKAVEDADVEDLGVTFTDHGTFAATLPKTGVSVEIKFLDGKDEKYITDQTRMNKKNSLGDSPLSNQLRRMLVSVNGNTDRGTINNLVTNMPAFDSRFIRGLYSKVSPNVDMNFNFECSGCGHEQTMEVPLTAEFFWPR